jgi:putative DNA primase/helicase
MTAVQPPASDPHAPPPGGIPLPDLSSVPAELRQARRWVTWRYQVRQPNSKPTKVPYQPNGKPASVTDPSTWCTFDEALAAAQEQHAGVGVVLGRLDDGRILTGIDLDDAVNDSGSIEKWAADIIEAIDSYTEISPSGAGVHILAYSKRGLPGTRRREEGIEFYDGARYFTCSGLLLSAPVIRDCTEALESLHRRIFGEEQPAQRVVTLKPEPVNTDDDPGLLTDDDRALVAAARAMPDDGELFRKLWDGNDSELAELIGHGKRFRSFSEADMSLASRLVALCSGDVKRATRLFRHSGLARDKWETHKSYVSRTLRKAAESYERHAGAGRIEVIQGGTDEDEARAKEEKCRTENLAAMILAADHFAVDPGGNLFYYSDGRYRPAGDEHVRRRVLEIMRSMNARWTSHRGNEVAEYIRLQSQPLWTKPPMDRINLRNGILRLTTPLELLPHSPDWLSTIQINASYDPSADCPTWKYFVQTSFEPDCYELVFEVAALLLVPYMSLQKAFLLSGSGGGGKSVFLRGLENFVGHENSAVVSLHDLEENRFAAASLYQKLYAYYADLPARELPSSEKFKIISGTDRLRAERKYENEFYFYPFARFIFSSNNFPKSWDVSWAYFRRWCLLKMEKGWDESSEKIPFEELVDRLSTEQERSGLLNEALRRLPRVLEHGLSEPESSREMLEQFRASSDPIAAYLDARTVLHSGAVTAKSELYRDYVNWVEKRGQLAATQASFGRALRRLRPGVKETQRWSMTRRVWMYEGIGLVTNEEPEED